MGVFTEAFRPAPFHLQKISPAPGSVVGGNMGSDSKLHAAPELLLVLVVLGLLCVALVGHQGTLLGSFSPQVGSYSCRGFFSFLGIV